MKYYYSVFIDVKLWLSDIKWVKVDDYVSDNVELGFDRLKTLFILNLCLSHHVVLILILLIFLQWQFSYTPDHILSVSLFFKINLRERGKMDSGY